MRHLLSLSLLLSLPAAATEPTWPDLSAPVRGSAGDGSKDAALVVGIQDYHSVEDVLGARDNAEDWYRWLAKARGVPLARVHRLIDGQAVDHRISAELRAATAEVQPGGTLWVVFIGHGVGTPDGSDALLVGADADASQEGMARRSVRRSELVATIETGRQERAVVVLDTCFSGKDQAGHELVSGSQSLVPVSARVKSSRVTLLTAAGAGEYAGRLPGTTRPAFSYLALGALWGWADQSDAGNQDGQVSAAEVRDYTLGALRATVRDRPQTPELDGPDVALSQGHAAGPDLVELAVAAPRALPVGAAQIDLGVSRTDFAALAAQAQAADAARARAEAAALAAAQAYAQEQRRQLDAAAATVRSQASRDFAAIAGLVSSPTASARPVLEAYAATYGAASVTVGDTTEPVTVPELARVQAALAVAITPTASSSQQTSKLGYDLVRIPAGSFAMGSPSSEDGRSSDETQHRVRLTRDFWLGKTEVTQGLWQQVMGDNPSSCDYKGVSLCQADYPVQSVSWVDAAAFANALSAKEGLESCYRISGDDVTWPKGQSCTGYRLPTEAEWEYAARAGEHGLYAGAESTTAACRVANVNTQHSTSKFGFSWDAFPCEDKHLAVAPVGSYGANAWGLHDMTGNVWEWTWDVYGAYPSGSVTDPTGASTGANRVYRGGCWDNTPAYARLAFRFRFTPGVRGSNLGLRLARSVP